MDREQCNAIRNYIIRTLGTPVNLVNRDLANFCHPRTCSVH